MKTKRVFLIVLCLCLFVACGKQKTNDNVASMWDLGQRYDSDYSKISHVYHYEKDDATFFLSVTRTKKLTDSLRTVKDKITVGSDVYALCETVAQNENGESVPKVTYECLNGSYHFTIGGYDPETDVSSILSLQEAAALIQGPLSPKGGVSLLSEEWTAYYRTQSSNLEIYVYPSDMGKACANADTDYEQRTEDGETYLYSEKDKAILYSNGTDTVWIRQADRSGFDGTLYSTLTECKAILSLLGTN